MSPKPNNTEQSEFQAERAKTKQENKEAIESIKPVLEAEISEHGQRSQDTEAANKPNKEALLEKWQKQIGEQALAQTSEAIEQTPKK